MGLGNLFKKKEGQENGNNTSKKKLRKVYERITVVEKLVEEALKEHNEFHVKLKSLCDRTEKVLAEIEGRIP